MSSTQYAFPSHPYFPENLVLDKSFSKHNHCEETTTSVADLEGHLPSLQEDEVTFRTTLVRPVSVVLTSDSRPSATTSPGFIGTKQPCSHSHAGLVVRTSFPRGGPSLFLGRCVPEYDSPQKRPISMDRSSTSEMVSPPWW